MTPPVVSPVHSASLPGVIRAEKFQQIDRLHVRQMQPGALRYLLVEENGPRDEETNLGGNLRVQSDTIFR